jgi:hypothetical protein
MLGLSASHNNDSHIKNEALELGIEEVPGISNKKISGSVLSHGELQKVSVGRALFRRPKLVRKIYDLMIVLVSVYILINIYAGIFGRMHECA